MLSGYFGQCKKLTKSFLIASPVLYCSVCQIVNKPARFKFRILLGFDLISICQVRWAAGFVDASTYLYLYGIS